MLLFYALFWHLKPQLLVWGHQTVFPAITEILALTRTLSGGTTNILSFGIPMTGLGKTQYFVVENVLLAKFVLYLRVWKIIKQSVNQYAEMEF